MHSLKVDSLVKCLWRRATLSHGCVLQFTGESRKVVYLLSLTTTCTYSRKVLWLVLKLDRTIDFRSFCADEYSLCVYSQQRYGARMRDCCEMTPDSVARPSFLFPPLTCAQVPGLQYHRDFLSKAEHDALLVDVNSRGRWKRLNARSLQNHGGLPHPRGMVGTPLPSHLAQVAAKLVKAGIFSTEAPSNHVLVNRYEPGEGIDAHEDGPVFLPCAAIVSLQAPVVMDFFQKSEDGGRTEKAVASIVLEPCSLLRIEGDAYTDHLHAIAATYVDQTSDVLVNAFPSGTRELRRNQRTSLTFRRSARTLKFRL